MTDELREQAARLRSDAQDLRRKARKAAPSEQKELFDAAAAKFGEAIAVLERGLRRMRRQESSYSPELCRLLEALSQTYGSLGGTWRDAGKRDVALAQYKKGNDYEKERREHCGAQDSYNMVQRLVVQLLIGKEPDFDAQLNEARNVIDEQFKHGRSDSWGLADLVLMKILCGEDIDAAIGELEKRNADTSFYESAFYAIAALVDEGLGKGELLGERLENLKRLLQRRGGLASPPT